MNRQMSEEEARATKPSLSLLQPGGGGKRKRGTALALRLAGPLLPVLPTSTLEGLWVLFNSSAFFVMWAHAISHSSFSMTPHSSHIEDGGCAPSAILDMLTDCMATLSPNRGRRASHDKESDKKKNTS
eukprot:CAMPEP_0206468092 /NCGR_PEP_ID=MMETSP0324_2-20121206/29414_1 /ASSEMBLY_ACC=CAM_ASM_000836 /TAXON_ID=2866 /ORGANISM="Crypthecodinium cohnii, Strain Seligo" /LENGTH=127 /DNA_ID=CAMNT_0053941465 /DNA_START=267 /DNA_END=649 /DNA_ORIENTATION=+